MFENYEFENRQNNKKQLHFSVFSANQKSFADRAKIKEFQFEEPFTDRKLSSSTLMEKMKLIVTGKWKTEYRNLSKLL